jgi:hypothetical protein
LKVIGGPFSSFFVVDDDDDDVVVVVFGLSVVDGDSFEEDNLERNDVRCGTAGSFLLAAVDDVVVSLNSDIDVYDLA